MQIAIIGNFSDRNCGFQNTSKQTVVALQRAGHDVVAYDGTYSLVYARREAGQESFLPPDPLSFDVIHVIWHPATLNHYAGAPWAEIRAASPRPILSVWNGCPAAWCPFNEAMDVKWGVLGKEEGHRQIWYPIPDWVEELPEPDSVFTVGYSGVRGEGVQALTAICAERGWATNFSNPEVWLSQEDEIRRLARSTINVGWYGAEHDDRSGSAMVCLASRRPFLCNDVRMFTHLQPYRDEVYLLPDEEGELAEGLDTIHAAWEAEAELLRPARVIEDLCWTKAVTVLEEGWGACSR